jgi:hypothetical protein
MPQVVLDEKVCQRLNEFLEPVDVCDPSGKVIGLFEPKFEPTKWKIIGPELSDEELDRRANSDEKRYTTEEVLENLKKLGSR